MICLQNQHYDGLKDGKNTCETYDQKYLSLNWTFLSTTSLLLKSLGIYKVATILQYCLGDLKVGRSSLRSRSVASV